MAGVAPSRGPSVAQRPSAGSGARSVSSSLSASRKTVSFRYQGKLGAGRRLAEPMPSAGYVAVDRGWLVEIFALGKLADHVEDRFADCRVRDLVKVAEQVLVVAINQ